MFIEKMSSNLEKPYMVVKKGNAPLSFLQMLCVFHSPYFLLEAKLDNSTFYFRLHVISLIYLHNPFLFVLRFYLLMMRDTHRERQRHSQREKQAPCRDPDMRLDPGSPGSQPGLKVVLNH